MDKFYDVNTKNKFNKTTEKLFGDGYVWVGLNKNPSFEQCKKQIHGNAELIIHAFYSHITKKNEMQFGTRSIYKTYPMYRNLEVISV